MKLQHLCVTSARVISFRIGDRPGRTRAKRLRWLPRRRCGSRQTITYESNYWQKCCFARRI